ncbi:hypothetical protein BS47DRAFT_1342035 [Hydnum rufescens UP504]|uniref:Uncharacterized protein n=1 Tax=Hydnum rufescens UP504 TaxID=1448309 RepID=A0A9P6B2X3_9AGAM|nr:hypothetical protein BS47DRAFT_1342035 [Hydnum rufescens UP504]
MIHFRSRAALRTWVCTPDKPHCVRAIHIVPTPLRQGVYPHCPITNKQRNVSSAIPSVSLLYTWASTPYDITIRFHRKCVAAFESLYGYYLLPALLCCVGSSQLSGAGIYSPHSDVRELYRTKAAVCHPTGCPRICRYLSQNWYILSRGFAVLNWH